MNSVFYEGLDWSKANWELAIETGIHNSRICRWRQRLGKPSPKNYWVRNGPKPKPTTMERLKKSVIADPVTGCWNWRGAKNNKGYGLVQWNRRLTLVHRAAWTAYRGPIPPGLNVLHRCDNRLCFNPDHLFLGTQLENCMDASAKGRIVRGEDHSWAKLTENQVLEIASSPETTFRLAKKFGVDRMTVKHIRVGKNWKWLTNIKHER